MRSTSLYSVSVEVIDVISVLVAPTVLNHLTFATFVLIAMLRRPLLLSSACQVLDWPTHSSDYTTELCYYTSVQLSD